VIVLADLMGRAGSFLGFWQRAGGFSAGL